MKRINHKKIWKDNIIDLKERDNALKLGKKDLTFV